MENEKAFRGVFAGQVWTLTQDDCNLHYTIHGPTEDINCEKLLSDYFRFDVSLKENLEKWSATDKHFKKALEKVDGVRILNQDVVENLFSFICSSNNNIVR